MKPIFLTVGALVVVCLALPGLRADQIGVGEGAPAQATPPVRDPSWPASATGTASIRGTVMTDDADSRPIRRAIVEATSGGWSGPRRQAISSDTGAFELTDLPAGRYTLSISKPGFVRTYYGARAGHREGVAIAVADGQRVANVPVRMAPGAVITGRVTDERGQPVEQAWLQVIERRDVGGAPVFGSSTSVYSDDRGVYRLHGLKAGTYVVFAAHSVMQSGSILTTTTAAPPAVGAARMFVPVYYPGTTDAAAATTVTVRTGEERTGVDFPLALVVTSRVSGTIARADGGALGTVQLFALSLGVPANFGLLASVPRAAVSPDGTFAFNGLAPGRYTLAARAATGRAPAAPAEGSPGTPAPPDLWASADLTVSGADINGVSLVPHSGMTVSGRIVFDGKTPPPAPGELTKGSIRLTTPPNPGPTIRPSSGAIRPDGSFSIEGIAPGTYGLAGYLPGTTGDRRIWELKSVTAEGRDLLDLPIEVQPGANISNVVATFTDRVTTLSGMLADQVGRPAPEYWILVFSTNPAHWRPQARRVPAPARPGSDGRYRITGLPPGEYYLAAIRDFDQQEYATPAFLEQVVPGAIKITIGEGEQKTQDIRLGV